MQILYLKFSSFQEFNDIKVNFISFFFPTIKDCSKSMAERQLSSERDEEIKV